MYHKLFSFKKLLPLGLLLIMIGYTGNYLSENLTVSSTANGRELPIYCVDTKDKKVGLSFDAAWGNEDTADILAILAKHKVHVTFFMTGGWVDSYPDDVKAVYEAGHDLGNHSQNHKNMSQLSNEENAQELMDVHNAMKELTGYEIGYEVVPISELIYREDYHMDVTGRQIKN